MVDKHTVEMRVWWAQHHYGVWNGACATAVAAIYQGLAKAQCRYKCLVVTSPIEWSGREEEPVFTGGATFLYLMEKYMNNRVILNENFLKLTGELPFCRDK